MTTANALVWRLDVEDFDDDLLVSVTTLQGLANREQPQVYLGMVDRHWSMKFRSKDVIGKLPGGTREQPYRSATDIWEDYYASTHGYQFRNVDNFAELLSKFRHLVRGAILVDMKHKGQYVIGATLAGLRDAVLVSESALADHPELAALPVLEDLRGKFTDSLAAHEWAVEHLQPQCNTQAIFSQTRTANEGDPDYFSLDLAVAQKLFVFSLCFRQCKAPQEFALIEKILSKLGPCSPMYGWGTSEDSMMVGMAKSGAFLVCTHTPNISFHAKVQPTRSNLASYLPPKRPRPKLQKDKVYITFMVNEGDTLKWMGCVMGHGQWLSPDHGSVPINWGTNPWLVEKWPGMMELFYRTIKPQDCFFSSITGYGYYNSKLSSEWMRLAKLEAQHNPAAGLTVGSIYSVHGMMDACNGKLDAQTDQWLVERGCRGYAFESAQQAYVKYTSAGQPVIGVDWALFYWMYRYEGQDPLQGAVHRIKQIADEHAGPFFIPVYAGSPTQFKQMAELLPKDRFEIVLLDEMIDLAIEARPMVEAQQAKKIVTPVTTPLSRTSQARVIPARKLPGNLFALGDDAIKNQLLQSESVEHDLSNWNAGSAKVKYQFGWDESHLYVHIQEIEKVLSPLESYEQRCYAANEFDLSDGVAFWMDFTNTGTRERGEFTPFFGFSSAGRHELYCCLLNDRVLTSVQPRVRVTTAVQDGKRSISAAIPWGELSEYLEPSCSPVDGLRGAIRAGFRFGCQPLLIEGNRGRAYLNGRSNKRQDQTAAALGRDGKPESLAPNGFDADSITVELQA